MKKIGKLNLTPQSEDALKNAFDSLKRGELKSISGGHGCTGLSVDCFCEPHCVSGKDCTNGWY
jgi:hypothetical protein